MVSQNKILIILIFVIFLAGCTSQAETENLTGNTTTQTASEVEKVEIIHFHGTNQCYSCITVGAYAEETVNTYFADELKNGKVSFAHINIDLPENKEIVMKYGATGSSLWIGIYYKNNTFYKKANSNVWYKINNKEEYMSYLKGIIDKRLIGDLS